MELRGRCACGRVSYRIADTPMFTHACHCLDCQRTTGSAFVVHMIVAEAEFDIDGATVSTRLPTGSGAGVDLHFCPDCGTYIWAKYLAVDLPMIVVRAGTLQDPGKIQPQAHIFTKTKQPWLELPDGIPEFTEAYDRNEVWPAESLARFHSL